MPRKNNKNTKGRIISAAWKLFYEQGYENTTIEDIIEESSTSRGTFYHYFEGKDSLLSSLSYIFDEKYEELTVKINDDMTCFETLMYLNTELFAMIENSISLDLLAMLYSSQLITKGDKHLLDHNRVYYKLLRKIASKGIENGEFKEEYTANEIVKAYAMCERALLYDWCLCNGDYSLKHYSAKMMPMFLKEFLK